VQTVDMSAAGFGSKAGPANYQRLAKGDGGRSARRSSGSVRACFPFR
jgi:hypothetical protein